MMAELLNLALTDSYDIELTTRGELSLVEDADAVGQGLQCRLNTQKREWELDLTIGVDYLERVLIKGAQDSVVRAEFVEQILASEGITEVVDLDLTLTGRTLTVEFTALTDIGAVAFVAEGQSIAGVMSLLLIKASPINTTSGIMGRNFGGF